MPVVNELVTRFGFTGNPGVLDDYNASLGRGLGLLGAFTAATSVATAAAARWADSVLSGVDALDALSHQTGIAASRIQQWRFLAGQSQSTAAAMDSTMQSLTDTIGAAAQQGSEDFARLGISVRTASGEIKTADTILGEVRQRFQQLDLTMAEQRHFAGALGIDDSLLRLLNRTDGEISGLMERARELGTLTGQQTEQARQYQQALNATWFSLNSVKQLIAVGVAPEMTRLADSFTEFLAANKDWITEAAGDTVQLLGDFFAALNRLTPVLAGLGAIFLAGKVYALGFSAAMAAVFSPAVMITAAIAGILLVIDDLIVAMRGGESVIADFFQSFFGVDIVPMLREIIEVTKQIAATMWEQIQPLRDMLKNVFLGIGALFSGDIMAAIGFITSAVQDFGRFLLNILTPVFDALGQAAGAIWDAMTGALSTAAGAVRDMFTGLIDWITATFIDPVRELFASAFSMPGDILRGSLSAAFDDLRGMASDFASYLWATISAPIDDLRGMAASILPDWITDWMGEDAPQGGSAQPQSGGGGGLRTPIGPGPARAPAASMQNDNRSVSQNVDMTIFSSDPEAAGRSARRNLQDQLTNAETQIRPGGF